MKLLLGLEDVNPDTPDTEHGRTPLSWAAENGYKGIVRLLLEREDVDPNSSSKSGQTPLRVAAQNSTIELWPLYRREIAYVFGNWVTA